MPGRLTPFFCFLRFEPYAFLSRIKFACLSVAKNAPLNARRGDNHGLKLRRKRLLWSVCQFSPVVQRRTTQQSNSTILFVDSAILWTQDVHENNQRPLTRAALNALGS